MNLQLPRHIAERLRFLANEETRRSGRKTSPQSIARTVLTEYTNAEIAKLTKPKEAAA